MIRLLLVVIACCTALLVPGVARAASIMLDGDGYPTVAAIHASKFDQLRAHGYDDASQVAALDGTIVTCCAYGFGVAANPTRHRQATSQLLVRIVQAAGRGYDRDIAIWRISGRRLVFTGDHLECFSTPFSSAVHERLAAIVIDTSKLVATPTCTADGRARFTERRAVQLAAPLGHRAVVFVHHDRATPRQRRMWCQYLSGARHDIAAEQRVERGVRSLTPLQRRRLAGRLWSEFDQMQSMHVRMPFEATFMMTSVVRRYAHRVQERRTAAIPDIIGGALTALDFEHWGPSACS